MHAVRLRPGVFGVEFEQTGGEEVGFFFGIYDVELPLEAGQSVVRALHFRVEFFHLTLHEVGEADGRLVADTVSVLEVRIGDGVGDIGGELAR